MPSRRQTAKLAAGLLALGALAGCGSPESKGATGELPALVLCPDHACVAVEGLAAGALERLASLPEAELRRTLKVRLAGDDEAAPAPVPPMLGRHAVEGSRLIFRPRLPFVPGVAYRAVFDAGARGAPPLSLHFVLPGPEREPPEVVSVFPPGPEVPANLLRTYLRFSRPMDPRGAAEHVRLRDGSGAPIPLAFVPVPEGLWSADGTRLTLLVHPGRVKRGVAPGEALGPVLRSGGEVKLTVDAAWRDAWGEPLGRPWTATYRVVAADREAIEPDRWEILTPRAGTRDPLRVDFGEPLDPALTGRWITVEASAGDLLPGTVSVTDDGSRWQLVPERPWSDALHRILVDPRIEDLAGNTVRALFDRPSGEPSGEVAPPPDSEPVVIPFRPSSAS